MQQSTKQRVVGILVILVAAVVLLPAIFDGNGSYQLPLETRIPEPAPFSVPPAVTAERPTIIADTAAIRIENSDAPAASQEERAETETEVPEEVPVDPPVAVATTQAPAPAVQEEARASVAAPVLDSVGLPQGWSVRLGVFSNTANVLNLVDRLQERGYKAYTREVSSAQGTLMAVFVGPGVDRAAMQQLQQQLQQEFQLAGRVVPYEIVEL